MVINGDEDRIYRDLWDFITVFFFKKIKVKWTFMSNWWLMVIMIVVNFG